MGEMKVVDKLAVLKFCWQKYAKIIGLATETAAIGKLLKNVSS